MFEDNRMLIYNFLSFIIFCYCTQFCTVFICCKVLGIADVLSHCTPILNVANTHGHNFERVGTFKYLGSIITSESKIEYVAKCFHDLRNVSMSAKMGIYVTVIRLITICGGGTWTLTGKMIYTLMT
jgi:hypothetical protein